MKYVVDTNVISELIKERPSQAVIDWFYDHEGDVYLNSVTIEELYFGMMRLPEGKRKRTLEEAITGIVMDCSDKTFVFDAFCGYLCARLHDSAIRQGRTPSSEDLMIAAIALRNDAILATHNTRDFEYLDVALEDPFAREG